MHPKNTITIPARLRPFVRAVWYIDGSADNAFQNYADGTPGIVFQQRDTGFFAAFQQLNRAILNPLFLMAFMGLVFLLPVTTWAHFHRPPSKTFWLLLAATLLYLVGVMGITMLGNVPMNEALDGFNVDAATPAQLATKRLAFESRWNFLNNIRTACSVVGFLLLLI